MSDDVNNCKAIIELFLHFGREKLKKKIIDFVEQNQGRKIILLVKVLPGFGKTFTGSVALLPREDNLTIWLAPRHKQARKEVIRINPDILHLKSRKQEGMCLNTDALERIPVGYNIDEKIICRDCEHFENRSCPYYAQFHELKDETQSWVGVHHHLKTKFVSDYFKRTSPFKCLVLDEYFINNIMNNVRIYRYDLEKLEDALTKISQEKYHTAYEVDIFVDIIYAMKRILSRTTSRKGITGFEFVDIFNDSINKMKTYYKEENRECYTEKHLAQKSTKGFIWREFHPELIRRIKNGEKIKNVLDELLHIALQCYSVINKPPEHDINLPFFSGMEVKEDEKTLKKYIQFSHVNSDLPDVPIIILDATGDAKFYGDLFNCEIEEYKPSIPIERNIIQITDGFYWKKTLKNPESRDRLFLHVYSAVKYHLEKGEKIVNISTYKSYIPKISKYLSKKGIEFGNVRFAHFGDTRGTNDMKDDKTLIIIGTYEPNILDYPKQVGVWYTGEKPISNKKINKYEYKDPRYYAHVRMVREHEIEQNIDRIRQINGEPNKTAYLFTKLPIAYETRKINGNELMWELESDERKQTRKAIINLRYDPIYVYLKHVKEGNTYRELHHRLSRNKPFIKDKNLLRRTKDSIIKLGFINEDVELTEKGREKLISMGNELESLYGDD